jgi:hypothetical protein
MVPEAITKSTLKQYRDSYARFVWCSMRGV